MPTSRPRTSARPRPSPPRLAALLVLALVLGVVVGGVATAVAQSTGGSYGGGSWSSGGGGSHSSSSSSSGGGGWSHSSSSGGSRHSSGGGGGGGDGGAMFGVLVVGVLFCAVVVLTTQSNRITSGARTYAASDPARADVTVIELALDARVRPFVQQALTRMAQAGDTSTPGGLAALLGETALLLRRLRDAWVYGGAYNHDMMSMELAHQVFERQVADARATFSHELIRNQAGTVTTAAAPALVRRPDEGPGLVLVTLVVASRDELFTVRRVGNGDDLRLALESLSAVTAPRLIAMEVVWTPADPDDRMSSVELEAIRAGKVFPIAGAMVGKVVCMYCSGPFPAELMSCPHCGGRAPT